jgi:hypothetical protein
VTPIESYESLKGSHVKIVVRRRSKDRIREQLSTAGGVRVIDLPRLGRVVAGAEHLEACHGRKLRMLAILGSCLASDLRVHAISGQVRDTLRKCLSVGVLSYTLLGLSGPMASGETQSQCPAVGGSEGNRTPNASVLCAALYMENGKVMVRGSPASVLYPSQSLERGRPVTAAKRARLEKDLLDQLAKALADAPGFYYFGLNDNERAKDDNHQLPAETKHPVDTYTIQVWNDQSGATYAEWADKVKGRLSFENALIKLVTHLRLDRQTGLSFPENGLDAEMGTLMLSVADLAPQIGDEQALTICIKDAMGQCGPSGDVLNRARLAQVLADFPGFTWRAAEIHDRLQQYYTNRGLSPQIEVSGSLEPRRIDITESGRIARILWSRNVDSKPVLQQEFLSILLSRKDFSFFSTHDLVADLEAVGQPTFRQLNYKINGSGTVSTGTKSINTLASPPPLYNLLSLQPQQAALESLGLIVTIRQGGSENSYDLIAQPKASDGATDRPQSAPSSPQIHSVESGTARASAQAG